MKFEAGSWYCLCGMFNTPTHYVNDKRERIVPKKKCQSCGKDIFESIKVRDQEVRE
jgi:hypothetical protein